MRHQRFARVLHSTVIVALLLGMSTPLPATVQAAPVQPQAVPGGPEPAIVRAAAVGVSATMTDAVIDANGNGRTDGGDRIRYTVNISNTGDMDAEGVAVNAGLDANAAFVPGSVSTTPLAQNDVFTVTKNATNTVLAVLTDNGRGADADPDGDSLTITMVDAPSAGGAAVNLGASVAYTPVVDFSGVETFTYTIADDDGHLDSATVTVTVIDDSTPANQPPIARDDTFNVAEDAANVILDVLADNGNGVDSDVDDVVLTVSDVGTPDSGGTAANLGASIAYTPAVDFDGSEVFTYTLADGSGGFDTATITVNITPSNDAPFFTSVVVTGAVDDVLYTYNITTADPDTGDTRTITATTKPAWTALSDNGDGSATLSGTPGDADVGDHSVLLEVEDAGGLGDTQTFTITVSNTNDPPVAVDDMAGVNEDDGATNIDVLANDTDPDSGDTKEVVSIDTTGITGTVVISGSGAGNSVTYDPNGALGGFYWLLETGITGVVQEYGPIRVTVETGSEVPETHRLFLPSVFGTGE